MAMRFVRKELGDEAKLVIYGHSMGTGITARAVAECVRDNQVRVDGVILDSPFHSFMDMPKSMSPNFYHYSSFIFDWQKFLEVADIEFNSAKWLPTIGCPVTILHAEHDPVCPIAMSERLVADVTASGKTNIKLIRFKEPGLGHIGISKHKDFPKVVHDAVAEAHKHFEFKSKI